MEQKFKKTDGGIDLRALREFCRKEGKVVEYRKGEQLEREGDPARWFAYVERGCFKYVTRGISDGRDHLTWFSSRASSWPTIRVSCPVSRRWPPSRL